MENLTKITELLTTISDPMMLVFLSCILALGIVGLALYALILTLKRERDSQ